MSKFIFENHFPDSWSLNLCPPQTEYIILSRGEANG